ncbi:hypothetical protein QUG71_07225 [Enterobacter asburiae]|uniref:hypothetical protein n=1 Tax=Enterobacter asburiae TaxID=61645 RepID=UPI0025A1A611|nr:hypothetical protein [Enterobacter asburiae]HDC4432346.1 hypothetical protein [Enterobacter cloacae]MDM6883747.1 hypothetical protein [Enterobacter asburiae]MDM7072686.1 hypothetical protein [Enterobacter asburiae]HBK4821643.1 hypothetical protein [Enterobacter asburiae]HBK4830531.1 hypothetical protein [Enterobacter asburiae]
MSTITKEFTKEQLMEKLQHRISVASGFPESEKAQMDLELARIALVSLEAEPVAWISERNLKNLGKSYSVYVKHEPVMVRPIPLYTAPPAPVENTGLQRKAAIHDALCEKYNVESLAEFVDWQRNHIAELEAAPPAPVGVGETAVMPDYPGYALTQRECFQAGWEAHHVAMLQAGAPVQFGWSKGHFGYHTLFNAIGKAVNIQGGALSISVSSFEDAMLAAAQQKVVK